MNDSPVKECLTNEIAQEMMIVARRLVQQGTRLIENMEIGFGQVPILRVLSEYDSLPQHQVAEKIHVRPATLCGMVKRMERSGLVQRSVDAGDARVTRISLTEAGKACCEAVFDAIFCANNEMLRGFTAEECEMLCGFIRRMSDNLSHLPDERDDERKL